MIGRFRLSLPWPQSRCNIDWLRAIGAMTTTKLNTKLSVFYIERLEHPVWLGAEVPAIQARTHTAMSLLIHSSETAPDMARHHPKQPGRSRKSGTSGAIRWSSD